jgi:hypothetical protein
MKSWQNFHYAINIDDARAVTSRSMGEVTMLAGATDVLFECHLSVEIRNNSEKLVLTLFGDQLLYCY